MVLESWKPKNRPLVRGPLIMGARGSVGGTEYRGAAKCVDISDRRRYFYFFIIALLFDKMLRWILRLADPCWVIK